MSAFAATRGEHDSIAMAASSVWAEKARVSPVSVYGNLYEEQNFISSCRVPGDEFKVPESSSDLAGVTLTEQIA